MMISLHMFSNISVSASLICPLDLLGISLSRSFYILTYSSHVIILVTHPIQYFVPLYQEMSKEKDLNLKVLFFSDETIKGGVDKHFGIPIHWDIPLLEGYNFKFLKNNSWKPSINNGFWGIMNLRIFSELVKSPKSLIIVSGWSNLTYLISFIVGRIAGHTMAIRCEAPYYKEVRNNL